MLERSREATLFDRASLDARIVFVAASLLLAFGFVALLDRVGAPERFVGAAAPWFTILALATLGFLLHSTRASAYYLADRLVPGAYAGFANTTIMVALLLPFAARFAGHSWFPGVVGGVFLGLACESLLFGPLLRKCGAYSINGLLSARFGADAPRIGLLMPIAASAALLAMAGDLIAVEALVDITGTRRAFAAFSIVAASLVIAGPGGLNGAIWTAAAAGGIGLFGFGVPVMGLTFEGALPVSLFDDGAGWSAAAALMSGWGITPRPMRLDVDIATTLALAAGVAALAPSLATSVVTADSATARRSGVAALLWMLVFATLISVSMAAAALSFADEARGKTAENLPDAAFDASARGLVSICGAFPKTPSLAAIACAKNGPGLGKPLTPANMRPVDPQYLLGSLPAFAALGAAASGLLASGFIALGLALSAMGLQACAATLDHDSLYRMRGEADLSSRRLALTRLALVVVAALGYLVCALNFVAAGELVALALAISSACVAPSMILMFWPRAGDREALVALAGGLLGLVAALTVAETHRRVEIYGLAGLAGATLGLSAGIISGLASEEEKPGARAFIVRLVKGDGRVLDPGRDG
jgi:cation/acetate symporter